MAMAYPEAVCLAKQMAEVLVGKEIAWSPSLLYHGFGIRESIPFLVEICGSGLVLNLYVARKPQFLLQGLSQCR